MDSAFAAPALFKVPVNPWTYYVGSHWIVKQLDTAL